MTRIDSRFSFFFFFASFAPWRENNFQSRDSYGAGLIVDTRGFQDKTGTPPKHVVEARKNLEVLRKKDPKTVKNTERFYFLK